MEALALDQNASAHRVRSAEEFIAHDIAENHHIFRLLQFIFGEEAAMRQDPRPPDGWQVCAFTMKSCEPCRAFEGCSRVFRDSARYVLDAAEFLDRISIVKSKCVGSPTPGCIVPTPLELLNGIAPRLIDPFQRWHMSPVPLRGLPHWRP